MAGLQLTLVRLVASFDCLCGFLNEFPGPAVERGTGPQGPDRTEPCPACKRDVPFGRWIETTFRGTLDSAA